MKAPGLRRAPQGRCSRTWRSSRVARSSAEEVGLKLDAADLSLLGSGPQDRVVTKGRHDHRGGRGRPVPTSRVESARSRLRIDNTDSDWDREKLQERLAKLAGGVALVQVGAATEVELKEKKHRIEGRASSATRAAIEEGIVAGGRHRPAPVARTPSPRSIESLEGDEATGATRSSTARARRAGPADRRQRR